MALVTPGTTRVAGIRRYVGLRLVTARALPVVLRVAGFCALGLLVALAMIQWSSVVPRAVILPVVVAAGFLLEPVPLALTYAVIGGEFLGAILLTPDVQQSSLVACLTVLATMGIMYWVARSRSHLGVSGINTDAILIDLRDRLRATSKLPRLPEPWHVDVEIRSAYGQGLSGDFVVTGKQGNCVQIALVDVSGKGVEAGTRSLMLAGAFSGLLGAVPPEEFLPQANRFLIEQRWEDNFATAVHVALDLSDGSYSIGHAGHPAAAQHVAGSGRWELADGASGCALGILEDVPYQRSEGVLDQGDALLLYTDGLIESRDRPLRQGLDRMLGRADLLVGAGYAGGAKALVADAVGGVTDDRAVVLIWRR